MKDAEVDDLYDGIKTSKGIGRGANEIFNRVEPIFYERAMKFMTEEEADGTWEYLPGHRRIRFQSGSRHELWSSCSSIGLPSGDITLGSSSPLCLTFTLKSLGTLPQQEEMAFHFQCLMSTFLAEDFHRVRKETKFSWVFRGSKDSALQQLERLLRTTLCFIR